MLNLDVLKTKVEITLWWKLYEIDSVSISDLMTISKSMEDFQDVGKLENAYKILAGYFIEVDKDFDINLLKRLQVEQLTKLIEYISTGEQEEDTKKKD